MRTPAWSPDRLRDPANLEQFIRVFEAVQGPLSGPFGEGTREGDRLRIVPLVFGLLPRTALVRSQLDERIKPSIKKHLGNLGIEEDERLVNVLKRLADQYYESGLRPVQLRSRKLGIESVRALRLGVYPRLRDRQCDRCAICGIRFGDGVTETLDHILPWRLAGDPYDGSNWQILCEPCNRGKREWFSALQSPQALNWSYGGTESLPISTSEEVRYLTLSLAGECEVPTCHAGPRDSELSPVCRHDTGLSVLDNLVVLCEKHSTSHVTIQAVVSGTSSQIAVERQDEGVAAVHQLSHHIPNEVFAGYVLLRRITAGGMAECYIGTGEETGEQVFIKRVRDDSPELAAIQREAEIYQKLERSGAEHTPHVVEFARSGGFSMLVTECADCDLEEFVRERERIPTNEVKEIVAEVIEGLTELHSADIVHRDLKPRNILRVDGRWLLCDFGISKDRRRLGGGRTFRNSGTSGYAAPEQLLSGVEAVPSADVYSLGKVIVYLLTGGTDVDRVIFRQWRGLIRECTVETPDERPSLSDVAQRLDGIEE